MAADCPVEAAVREPVAVVETLLLTVTRSVEKLAATVETLSERVNQERGQNSVTSRLDSAVITGGAGLAGALIMMLINLLLHHAP
jgi:fatty acid desaturase